MRDLRLLLSFALVGLAVARSSSRAEAANFGEVSIDLETELQGSSTHGYAELWFSIVNKSETASHEVRLTLPKGLGGRYGDYLRSITRTVVLEPKKSVKISIAYPERQTLDGVGIGVAIDGDEKEEAISFSQRSTRSGYGGFSSRSSGSDGPLVLCSKTIDPAKLERPWDFGFGPDPRGGMSHSGSSIVRSTHPVTAWSPNWLGYSRYDGIVVTAEEMRAMPVEVRSAIGQFVECGGTLLVFGGEGPLPGSWKLETQKDWSGKLCMPGFGACYVTQDAPGTGTKLDLVRQSWQSSWLPWQQARTVLDANRVFPVVEDMGVPVRGLLLLMFVFAMVIGPVNLYVLARRKTRLWLFWTVPLISFLTCIAVLGSMVVSEGWSERKRVEGITVLDENSRRATTLGWLGVYTPLLPGGGLHFSTETEANYQNQDEDEGYGYRRRRSGSPLSIDWTRDQHLVSGWLTPRIPSHFVLRKGESRRERVTIAPGADGKLEAANGLGANIVQFWFRDEKGSYHSAEKIPAGGKAGLSPTVRSTAVKPPDQKPLRTIYTGDWVGIVNRMKTSGPDYLAPRTYVAILDAAPFLDDPAAKTDRASSVIFGILKEGNDGG